MDRYQQNRARVRARARTEAGKALAGGDAQPAIRKLQRLIDEEVRRLPADDKGQVACAAGCAMCCHLRVMATPPEVFQLVRFLETTLDADAFAAFRARVHEAAETVHALPDDRVLTTNVACPVLVDGRCSGYAARPFNCRSYHSLDVAACRSSFERPEAGIGKPEYTAVARVHEGAQGGFIDALKDAGRDAAQRELVTALDEALSDRDCETRFAHGEPAFKRARRID